MVVVVSIPCFRQERHPSATPLWDQVCRRCPAECPGVLQPAHGSPWLQTGCPGSAWGSLPNREAFHLPLYYYLIPLPTRPATHKPISPPTSTVIHSSTEPFTCLLSHFSTHKPCSHPQTYLAIHKPIDSVTHKAIHLPAISLLYPQTLQLPTDPSTHLHTSLLIHSPAYYLIPLPTSPAATHKPIHPPTSPAATHKPIYPPTSPAATHKPIHPPTRPAATHKPTHPKAH